MSLWGIGARFSVLLLLFSLSSPAARGEDFPFGSADKEFEKGFGKAGGLTAADRDELDEDRLRIGGSLWMQLQYYGLKGQGGQEGYLFSPNTAWLYFDSRLREDVRAYIKLQAGYDPTASGGGTSPFTGEALQETNVDLEEAKLLFNVEKTVFFTVGKQKIKWGSGKFWNPTDFLNTERRDLLYNEDRRLGVNLLKTHVPVGSTNFYLVQRIEGSSDPGLIQHAVRGEVPVGPAEISATASFLRGEEPTFGLDLSTALWDLDAHGEVSHTQGGPLTNYTLGLSYDIKYSDSDLVTFSLEYFRNSAGLTNPADYASVILAGSYQPFHLARDYGMFMVYLPTPGRWEKVSFTLFNIFNLTDRSAASKLMATLTFIQDLSIDLGLTAHYGESNGEMQIGGQFLDGDLRLRVDF